MDKIQSMVDRNMLCGVAIDEAHSISESSADFRPAYLTLDCIRSTFPSLPVTAVTATETHRSTTWSSWLASSTTPTVRQMLQMLRSNPHMSSSERRRANPSPHSSRRPPQHLIDQLFVPLVYHSMRHICTA